MTLAAALKMKQGKEGKREKFKDAGKKSLERFKETRAGAKEAATGTARAAAGDGVPEEPSTSAAAAAIAAALGLPSGGAHGCLVQPPGDLQTTPPAETRPFPSCWCSSSSAGVSVSKPDAGITPRSASQSGPSAARDLVLAALKPSARGPSEAGSDRWVPLGPC